MADLGDIVFGGGTSDVFTKKEDKKRSIVDIRGQQRTGRKNWTLVSGLKDTLDLKKILKYIRKLFKTNGTIRYDEQHGYIIQVQGDIREEIAKFLRDYSVCTKDDVINVRGWRK